MNIFNIKHIQKFQPLSNEMKQHNIINIYLGFGVKNCKGVRLERSLRGRVCSALAKDTNQFPMPTLGGSQLPVKPTPGYLISALFWPNKAPQFTCTYSHII